MRPMEPIRFYPSDLHRMDIPTALENAIDRAYQDPARALGLLEAFRDFPWEAFDEPGERMMKALNAFAGAILDRRYTELEGLRERALEAWRDVIAWRLAWLAENLTPKGRANWARVMAEHEKRFEPVGWEPASEEALAGLEGPEEYALWRRGVF